MHIHDNSVPDKRQEAGTPVFSADRDGFSRGTTLAARPDHRLCSIDPETSRTPFEPSPQRIIDSFYFN
jgi:hypothetical protein